MTVRFGYENLLAEGTLDPTIGAETGFPTVNVTNWNLYDAWRSDAAGTTTYFKVTLAASAPADYWAMYAHNMGGTGSSIKAQYWNGSGWSDAGSSVTPTDASPVFVSFPQASSTQWQLEITAAAGVTPEIGVAAIGKALDIPAGLRTSFKHPLLANRAERRKKFNDRGIPLPHAADPKVAETSLDFQYLDPVWTRDNWGPFMAHARRRPFFLSVDVRGQVDAAFCWNTKGIPTPRYNGPNHMSFSIPVNALVK